jgi:AcrR family transcriptional regulator
MAIEDRRARDRAARRRLIVDTARKVAEAQGWDAVTTRRLADEIEYSQPVLYKHFASMDDIAAAVAIDGFNELAVALAGARAGAATPELALRQVAHAYIDFAQQNPALYDAMFIRATTLHFATAETPPQLSAAFAELRAVVSELAHDPDVDTRTEVLWAAIHGLITLTRSGRLRPEKKTERIDLLVAEFSDHTFERGTTNANGRG